MAYNEGECVFPFWKEETMFYTMSLLVSATKPEDILYGYGPLGVAVVALSYFGYKMFKIILTDRDKAISQRDILVEDVFTKVLPAISKNTGVLEKRQDLDIQIISTIKDFTRALDDNTKATQELVGLMRYGRGSAQTGGP